MIHYNEYSSPKFNLVQEEKNHVRKQTRNFWLVFYGVFSLLV